MDYRSQKCPTPQQLHEYAAWIRDDLDPAIAREGPEIMAPDDVITLHELFLELQRCTPSVTALKYSRIHYAIMDISGKATRWPSKLADECDSIIRAWERVYGSLNQIRSQLYGPGGRLWRICAQRDLTRESLLHRWRGEAAYLFTDSPSMRHGDLGFVPGSWWINGMLAFREGIIDQISTNGGIVANQNGAYALVMKDSDEVEQGTSYKFTYRCKPHDPGRFRLTAADYRSRHPVRVLRSHSSSSMWAPRAGIRYEGTYGVTGWIVKPCEPKDNEGVSVLFLIKLEREPGQMPMEEVMKHPTAEEVDDYKEYKRLRRVQRELLHSKAMAKVLPSPVSPRLASVANEEPPRPLRRENTYKDGMPILRVNTGRQSIHPIPGSSTAAVYEPRFNSGSDEYQLPATLIPTMPGGFPSVTDVRSLFSPDPRQRTYDGVCEGKQSNIMQQCTTGKEGSLRENDNSISTFDLQSKYLETNSGEGSRPAEEHSVAQTYQLELQEACAELSMQLHANMASEAAPGLSYTLNSVDIDIEMPDFPDLVIPESREHRQFYAPASI